MLRFFHQGHLLGEPQWVCNHNYNFFFFDFLRTSASPLSSGVLTGVQFAPLCHGTWAHSGALASVTSTNGGAAGTECWSPGMRQNVLLRTGRPPWERSVWPPRWVALRLGRQAHPYGMRTRLCPEVQPRRQVQIPTLRSKYSPCGEAICGAVSGPGSGAVLVPSQLPCTSAALRKGRLPQRLSVAGHVLARITHSWRFLSVLLPSSHPLWKQPAVAAGGGQCRGQACVRVTSPLTGWGRQAASAQRSSSRWAEDGAAMAQLGSGCVETLLTFSHPLLLSPAEDVSGPPTLRACCSASPFEMWNGDENVQVT